MEWSGHGKRQRKTEDQIEKYMQNKTWNVSMGLWIKDLTDMANGGEDDPNIIR